MEQNQNFAGGATENAIPSPVDNLALGETAESPLPARRTAAIGAAPLATAPRDATFWDKWSFYTGNIRATWDEFTARLKRPVDTIFAVGIERFYEGDVEDAAMRFRLATRFRKDDAELFYFLGSSELILGNLDAAADAFRSALAINPGHEETLFRLTDLAPDMVADDRKPRYTPLRLVVEQADASAFQYDDIHLNELGYRGHEIAYQSVLPYLNPEYKNFRLLDLGCGTGLAGMQFRNIATRIEGVDVSENMLSLAEQRRDDLARRIYDNLHLVDLRKFLLDQQAESADIILAANVMPYVGGLTPVFDGARHTLRPGGIFSFSVDPIEGADFALISGMGHFGHSDLYIRELAARAGLDLLEALPFEVYFDEPAIQYVLRKPNPADAQLPQNLPPQEAPPTGVPPVGTPPATA